MHETHEIMLIETLLLENRDSNYYKLFCITKIPLTIPGALEQSRLNPFNFIVSGSSYP